MKIRFKFLKDVLVVTSVSTLGACGGVKNSSEYKELDEEVSTLSKRVEELETLVTSYETSLNEREASQKNDLETLK